VTAVLVPWRTDHGPRAAIYRRVRAQMEELGWPIIEADSGGQPFSIAATWNRAFEACDDDVVVQWGADFLLEDVNTLRIAVLLAEAGRPYVYAFDRVTKLSLGETTLVLRGRRPPRRDDKPPFGGVRAVRREVWEAGRYDERFVGWGHEDRAFVHAMRINGYERTRVPGRMILLRHPGRSTAKRGDAYYANEAANLALMRRYEAARSRAALEVLHSESTVAPFVG
jgi:hypothetical protein